MIEPGQYTIGGQRYDVVDLEGGGLRAHVCTLGATLVGLWAPSARNGVADVTLGYDRIEDYLQDAAYLGAAIGPVAGRIQGAAFEVDGETHDLEANDGDNTLHSGPTGLHRQIWRVEQHAINYVTLAATHPDGAGGFPATLEVRLTLSLVPSGRGGALRLDWLASTSAPTPVAPTYHAYWNLNGHDAGTVLDHVVQSDADRVAVLEDGMTTTGETAPVEGTPFDVRTPTRLRDLEGADHPQIEVGDGVDHDWLVPPGGRQAPMRRMMSVWSHQRRLDVWSTEPGIHLYTGGTLEALGKGRTPYRAHSGFALEAPPPPDAQRWPGFPDTILRPGETFQSRTEYVFS
ncbi:aldose epimerase family protein [Rubrivirga sp.]|uniref:aldose epimerase family protein n=1 Tax=Rubrivirga sp. TaxID=1885344 RepID=UPI003C72BC91